MPFTLHRLVEPDGALLDQSSHWDTDFISGARFDEDFEVPVRFELDTTVEGRRLPTLFTVPAFVAHPRFFDLLTTSGVANIDAYPAEIVNPDDGKATRDYLVLNVVGLAACTDVDASESVEMGEGLRLIDAPVLLESKMPEEAMFRLAEDNLQIVVSDALAARIRAADFHDVYLKPVETR